MAACGNGKYEWDARFHWVAMAQMPVTDSCLWRSKSETEWIASFDTDEYLTPKRGFTNIKQALRQYENPSTVLQMRQYRFVAHHFCTAMPTLRCSVPFTGGQD